VDGGLTTRDGKPPSEFQIADDDGKFVPAEAMIDGDTVVVAAQGVSSPTQVQFGWHNLADSNLTNRAGLPASPFETNDWLGDTGE
jgi:sialate O-acetylesterase